MKSDNLNLVKEIESLKKELSEHEKRISGLESLIAKQKPTKKLSGKKTAFQPLQKQDFHKLTHVSLREFL